MSMSEDVRRGWLLVVGTSLAYAVAVLQRSVFGVRVSEATLRYDISPSSLAYLPAASLLAYALMQLPVGVLLDRLGPRIVAITAITCLAGGSVGLGLAHDLSQAIVARVLLGLGDACTYLSVLRVAGTYLPPKHFGLASAFANACGAAGQLVGTFPLTLLLVQMGWARGFVAVGLVTALLLIPLSRLPSGCERPPWPGAAGPPARGTSVERGHSTLFAGLCHALLMSQFLTFTIMWGHPYLTRFQGMSSTFATGVIAASIVSFGCSSAIMSLSARLTAPNPKIVAVTAVPSCALWVVTGSWPTPAPLALTVLLSISSGVAAAAVAVTFAIARSGGPNSQIGFRTGVVNMTSFMVTSILLVFIGIQRSFTDTSLSRLPLTLAFSMLLLGVAALIVLRWDRFLRRPPHGAGRAR